MESRRIGVAVDFSEGSKAALRWAVGNLLRAGDHLIVVIVVKDADKGVGLGQLWEASGSPLIPLLEFADSSVQKRYGVKPDAELLDILTTAAASTQQAVVVAKIFWGDPREKICEAINGIPLSCLVIGSRGLGKISRVLLGSVSDYVVKNAPCPVTVVKGGDTNV